MAAFSGDPRSRAALRATGGQIWRGRGPVVVEGGRGCVGKLRAGAAWWRASDPAAVRKVVGEGAGRRVDGGSHWIRGGGGVEWPGPLRFDTGEAGLVDPWPARWEAGAVREGSWRRSRRLAAAHWSRRWRGLWCEVGDVGGVGEVDGEVGVGGGGRGAVAAGLQRW